MKQADRHQIFNPYLPSCEYVPDGEPHVFNGRLYIFGSHDKFGGGAYCQNDYVSYSADICDLNAWTYHGVIYRCDQDPHGYEDTRLYAPDVVQGVDGRYYLYYSVVNSSVISVAVCDTPAGQYTYYGDVSWQNGHVYGTDPDDAFQFDPAVLVEGKKVYLYSGFKLPMMRHMPGAKVRQKTKGAFVAELAEDMLTIIGRPKEVLKRKLKLGLHNFFEASSIRKFGDLYYFIYSSNYSHELCYAVSRRPDEGFRYQGVLYSNGNVGVCGNKKSTYPTGNNHGSIICINGEFYVFGHRHTNRDGFSRQGIADKIKMGPDGKFQQAEYTSAGLNNGPLIGGGCYPAYITCFLQGKKRRKKYIPYVTQSGQDRDDGENQYVADWRDGGVIGFTYFRFERTKKIRLKLRGNAQGMILISPFPNGQISGKTEIDISDSEKWRDVYGTLCMPQGVSGIYMMYQGRGTLEFMEFEIY